jgi:hypothetical protein
VSELLKCYNTISTFSEKSIFKRKKDSKTTKEKQKNKKKNKKVNYSEKGEMEKIMTSTKYKETHLPEQWMYYSFF